MPSEAGSPVERIRQELNSLKTQLSKSKDKQVRAKSLIDKSKKLVQNYFSIHREQLIYTGLDDESLGGLDTLMQDLLSLTQRSSQKTTYEQKLKSIGQELNGVEVALLAPAGYGTPSNASLDAKELRIAETLEKLVSSAGVSYRQACTDLRDSDRLSYRGAAAELREALREVLDYLAPDNDVAGQDGFKLENNQTKPTMKQKVRYILRSRGMSKTATETPEHTVEIIDEMVGALARSVYKRSSLSTHVGTTKQEVRQVKAYVDVVLGELLEIA